MKPGRWHDLVIVAGVLAVAAVGVWALWWNELHDWIYPGGAKKPPAIVAPPSSGMS